jgi:ribonuclease P protein component
LRLETLKTRAEFNRVRSGSKWTARSFLLQGLPRSDAQGGDTPRFGFTVSSKALTERPESGPRKRAGAVLRNRARRRLKEAARLLAPDHAKPNYDYVLVGRREALHQAFADLLEDLKLAFGKVHRPPRAEDGKTRPRKGRQASAGKTQRETEGT